MIKVDMDIKSELNDTDKITKAYLDILREQIDLLCRNGELKIRPSNKINNNEKRKHYD